MGSALEKPTSKFAELARTYCDHLLREGVEKAPFADLSTPLFTGASSRMQQQALTFLETQNQIFDEMIEARESLKDNHRLLWRTLGRLKMTPETDVFDKLDENLVVEIFNLDHVHVGWNMRLMELLSHTLEQVLCVPWFDLVERETDSSKKMFGVLQSLLSQEIKGTFSPELGAHRIVEKNSTSLNVFDFDILYTSPLWQSGKIVGYMAISDVNALGSLRPQSDNVFL